MSLMSISQLTDFDCRVIFNHASCRVKDRNGAVIEVRRRHSGVYALETLRLPSSPASDLHCHLPFRTFISGIIA